MLNVIDEFTRGCIAIKVERKLKAALLVIRLVSDPVRRTRQCVP